MLRTGSICASFLYKYITSTNTSEDNFTKRKETVQLLSDVFADCGGLLSKISQIINIEVNNDTNNVFSDCKPYNAKKTIEFILKELESMPCIKDFDDNIYKSGSIGQVHIAKLIDGTNIVVKVQYYDISEQIKNDIEILKKIQNYLFIKELPESIDYIEKQLYKELEYKNEVKNHKKFYNLWKLDENIKISDVYENLSTDKIIVMNYIEGVNFSFFINNSTQDKKNKIAYLLFKFIFQSFLKYGLFYCDIHYGNFLIQNDNILCVMDYGNICEINEEILYNLKLLYNSLYNDDKDLFFLIVEELGILTDKITSTEDLEYMYQKFKIMLKPLLCKSEYTFDKNWVKDLPLHSDDLTINWEFPANLLCFIKIFNGLFSILCNMEATLNMSEIVFNLTN